MSNLGRPSAASMEMAELLRGEMILEPLQRHEPPDYFDQEHRDIWFKVINSVRADWFTDENVALLEGYCCHYVSAAHLNHAVIVAQADPKTTQHKMSELYKNRIGESKMVASLSRSMRLNQSSTKVRDVNRAPDVNRPWTV